MVIQPALSPPYAQPNESRYMDPDIKGSATASHKPTMGPGAGVDPIQNPTQTGQENPESSNLQKKEQSSESKTSAFSDLELTQDELRMVEQLKQIDTEVRSHEMAHLNAGGAYITSGASFTYKQGPDGKRYAIGGEVGIDVSPVPGDPQATVKKMRQIRSAALAPANPSSQDLKVAANASSESIKAMSEITISQAEDQAKRRETQAFSNTPKQAANAYSKVNTLPETDISTFKLAV